MDPEEISQFTNLKKHWKVLIPITVFSILYFVFHRFGGSIRLSDLYLRGDERVSLNVALNLITYSATNGPYDVSDFPYQTGMGGFWVHPPLYYIIIAPIASHPMLCRLLSLSFVYINIILVYFLTNKHFGHGGYISASILAFIPSMIVRGDIITMDMLLLTFILLTLYFHANNQYRAVLICCALGINIKYPFGLVLFPLATRNKRVLLGASIVMIIALLPFGLWSFVQAKDFLMLKAWIYQSAPWYTDYRTPGRHWILLAAIVGFGMIRRYIVIRRDLPFLMLIFGNIIQFYIISLRYFYYLLPSYAVLSILAGSYMYLEGRYVIGKLYQRYPWLQEASSVIIEKFNNR